MMASPGINNEIFNNNHAMVTALIPITQATILKDATDKLLDDTGPEISSLTDFDYLRVTKEKDIPQPEPTITIGGAAVASPGNITAIGAAAKTGKTATVGVISAGAISSTGDIDGFPDILVRPNPDGKAVIAFDSEQSEADQQHNINTVLKRASMDETPDYYRAYNIRQLSIKDYQAVTTTICDLCSQTFGGVHMVIIDGGADYIHSVNDEIAATNIIEFFTHLAIKHDCPVIVIVHQNPNSDKERGHFGSEIQRKCYGLLTLTREGDVSTLAPKIMRKAGNADIPLISFKYCKEKGYHVSVDSGSGIDQKAVRERARLKELAESVFAPPSAFIHKDAVGRIMQSTNKGMTTAKGMLGNMEGFGYVSKSDDNFYRLNIERSTKVNEGQTDP